MRTFRTELKKMYRDYYNNYLTIETFAEHHAVAYEDMEKLIEIGKLYHDTDADFNVETRKKGMSLFDIETAIHNGYTVYWKNRNYEVVPTLRGTGELLIKCLSNAYCVGLTRTDGTLVEDPKHFFLGLEH
jgi:hypothetical protein